MTKQHETEEEKIFNINITEETTQTFCREANQDKEWGGVHISLKFRNSRNKENTNNQGVYTLNAVFTVDDEWMGEPLQYFLKSMREFLDEIERIG